MRIESQVPLKHYTTLQTGGPAEYFAEVTTIDELREATAWARREGHKVSFLGGGSNVLVADAGRSGLTIHVALSGIMYTEAEDHVLVTAAAGETFDNVIALTVVRDYWGLENLSHIPGSVGATPVQNVGAYGVEVQDVIESVEVYDLKRDQVRTLEPRACYFKYRDSIFKYKEGAELCVTAVTYRLSKQPKPKLGYKDLAVRFQSESSPAITAVRAAIIEIRGKKFPDWKTVGTAGSFFKNPIIPAVQVEELLKKYPNIPLYDMGAGQKKVALGWILEHICHLKGVRSGDVGTYEGQALVLVQYGRATSDEVIAFAKEVAQKVFDVVGIKIEWEVSLWK